MSYIAERRQEEKERRRAELIDAAERVALAVGWDALTMERVAREARLSRALVYLYFKDKEDLMHALVERALKLLAERFEAAVARHGSGLAQVSALGRAYVAYAQEFPHYFNVLARFQAHEAKAVEAGSNEAACLCAGNRVHGITAAAIGRGIADGSIRADLGPPLLTALTLWGYMHGIVQIVKTKAEAIAADGFSTEALIDHAIRMAGLALSRG
jgi:AcrR family transcriptional regulator